MRIFVHIRLQQRHGRLPSHRLTGQRAADVDVVALPEVLEDRDPVHLRAARLVWPIQWIGFCGKIYGVCDLCGRPNNKPKVT